MRFQERAYGQQEQLVPRRSLIQRAAGIGQRNRPRAGADRDLVPGGALRDLIGRQVAVQQAGVKQLAQDGQALVIPPAQRFHVAALHALLVELVAQFDQHRGQLGGVDRLEDVLGHPHAHRLTRVFEIVKARENNKLGSREGLLEPPAQLQPVHKGHFDVGQHHIGTKLFGQLKGHFTVVRLADQIKAKAVPVDFAADAGADLFLIIGQQDTIAVHPIPPFG